MRRQERATILRKVRSDWVGHGSHLRAGHAQEQPHPSIPRTMFWSSGGRGPTRSMFMRDMNEHKITRCAVCCRLPVPFRMSSQVAQASRVLHRPLPDRSTVCSLTRR